MPSEQVFAEHPRSGASRPGREGDYRAFIGRHATDYYLRQFARFDAGAPRLSLNLWALLLTLPWLAWRRLWRWATVYFAAPLALALWKYAGPLPASMPPLAFDALLLAWALGFPLCCNRLYWRRARAAIAEADLFGCGLAAAERASDLASAGGTSRLAMIAAVLLQFGQAAAVPLLSLHFYEERALHAHALEVRAGAVDEY